MSHTIDHRFSVLPTLAGVRLDKAVSTILPEYSRSTLQTWITEGALTVQGNSMRSKDKLAGREEISLKATPAIKQDDAAEDIPLDILYEDTDLLVINKPAGLVVHPAAGNPHGTLVNALLHWDATLAHLPRAGLIHRLDKDTTGLLLIGRHLKSFTALKKALEARTIHRHYRAIVKGMLTGGGTLNAPIGRHPTQRIRMAVTQQGRPAVTHYRLHTRYREYTELHVQLETGRTHQIRVHMAHARHPIVGDPLYQPRAYYPKGVTPELKACLNTFKRQALHAEKLSFQHPMTSESLELTAPLPDDFQQLKEALTTFSNMA